MTQPAALMVSVRHTVRATDEGSNSKRHIDSWKEMSTARTKALSNNGSKRNRLHDKAQQM